MEHQNIFHKHGGRESVYSAFQGPFASEVSQCRILTFLALATFGGAAYLGPTSHGGWVLLVLGLAFSIAYLTVFIENSNRDWAMHVIDWIEASKTGRESHDLG